MTHSAGTRIGLLVLVAGVLLAGCQEQRNEFNPVRFLCPGYFDPDTNTCQIATDRDVAVPPRSERSDRSSPSAYDRYRDRY